MKNSLPFLGRRFLFHLASLLTAVTLTFILMHSIPGDPFLDEQTASKETHSHLMRIHGLQEPWLVQYGNFLGSVAHGDLGSSIKYPGRSVNEIISETFPISALLGLCALIIAFSGGITLGLFSTFYVRTWKDQLVKILTSIGLSIPSFILAIGLQYALACKMGLFPVARCISLMHFFLPVISLAFAPLCYIYKLVRANMVEVMKQDYMKAAQAKGLTMSKMLTVHGLRNALIPLLPYFGQLTANILVGSFVIEKIFSIPGLGQWFVRSIHDRDYPVILGLTVFYSCVLLGVLFIVDCVRIYLDPRLKTRSYVIEEPQG